MDQLLEPSKRNDKSLNQDIDLNKNCVSKSTLNPPILNPKFPSLLKMRGFKIAFLNICSLTCHYDDLCVFMEDRTIDQARNQGGCTGCVRTPPSHRP